MQGRKLGEQVEYWKEQLADAPLLLQLPTDFPRPTRQSFDGGKESLRLSAGLSEQLMLMSRKQGVTLHMLLLTAFNILLSRYSGQEDIVVGTPTAGRERKEIESLIGCFINTLALRTDLSGNPSFKQLLGRVREVCLGAYQHQDVPFEKLVEELRPERSLSHTPLFQVYFNMLNLPEATVELPDLLIEHMSAPETGSKFDLTLYVKEQAAGILFALVYNTALFGQPRMAILLEQFEHLLSQIADRPEAQISCFSLVTPGTEKRLPDPAQDLPSHWQGAVTTLFALQAQKHPENLAVMDYQEAWTYQELDERSNRLARYLLAREIPQEGVVAVYAHRSAALVWALLGILKAGAMFVILDPAYPEERLIDYLKASGAKGFLQIEAAGELPPRLTERVADSSLGCRLRLGRKACAEQASAENVRPELQKALWETDNVLKDFPATDPCVAIGPDTLAYIGFTSGSTGKPKGIVGKHQSLALFGRWLEERFDINESDRFSMLSGLSHDPLQRDIFTTLQIGAGLFIPDPKEMGQPGWLTHWLKREEISVINLTPAMGQLLSEMAPRELQGGLTSLRYAFYVGDALTRGDIKRLRQIAPSVTCINLYGATETQRALSYYLVGADQDEVSSDEQTKNLAAREVLPVGIGIKEVQLLVLNKFEQLAGVGEVGEVCFRSPHLARGYLEDSALTHQKFIVNPLTRAPHDRLYRSGDLGRYLPDGDVALMGRQDFQVQIRGFRIELGEVESVLYRHAAVGACAVIAREDVPGDKRLVGYIVPGEGEPPTASHLRAFLRAHLPEFMVPHTFINLTALPLTPNGKVDRRALPAPEQAMAEREHVAPRTPIEKSLAEIWENLLGQTRVGVHDNFFELGGHSLLATRVISHLRDATDVELTLRTLFESPTIADLAVIVVQKQAAQRQSHEIEEIITGLEQLTEDELRNMLTGERGLETDAQRLLSSVTAQQLVEPSAGTDETGMA
jgi:amino acid adenylation domain-containing protein